MPNEINNDLLGRLDERSKSIQLILEKLENDLRVNNDTIHKKIDITEIRLSKRIDDIETDIEKNFVRKDQFTPIQKIVYGLVGLTLTTVLGALIATVVYKPTAGGG